MNHSLLRSNEELSAAYERHVNTIYRVCLLKMKNRDDAEDMVQDTFVRFMASAPEFENFEHEKAWLIRVAINLCLNRLRHWWRKNVSVDRLPESSAESFVLDETINKVMSLPPKCRTAVYLYYYEGYKATEIAQLMGTTASTVRGRLHTGRKLLKMELDGDGA